MITRDYTTTRSSLHDLGDALGSKFRREGWYKVGQDWVLVVKEQDDIWHALTWIASDPRPYLKFVLELPVHQ